MNDLSGHPSAEDATGLVVEPMGADEARALTTEAQTEFRSAGTHFDRAWQLVEQAVLQGGYAALGYRSAGDYLATEFADVLSGLDVGARRAAVRELSGYGLSTRAIAPVVGVSPRQAAYDRRSGVQSLHTSAPVPGSTVAARDGVVIAEQRHIDLATGEVVLGSVAALAEVVANSHPISRGAVDNLGENLASAVEVAR